MGYKYSAKIERTKKDGTKEVCEYCGVSNEHKAKRIAMFDFYLWIKKGDSVWGTTSKIISYDYKLW